MKERRPQTGVAVSTRAGLPLPDPTQLANAPVPHLQSRLGPNYRSTSLLAVASSLRERKHYTLLRLVYIPTPAEAWRLLPLRTTADSTQRRPTSSVRHTGKHTAWISFLLSQRICHDSDTALPWSDHIVRCGKSAVSSKHDAIVRELAAIDGDSLGIPWLPSSTARTTASLAQKWSQSVATILKLLLVKLATMAIGLPA